VFEAFPKRLLGEFNRSLAAAGGDRVGCRLRKLRETHSARLWGIQSTCSVGHFDGTAISNPLELTIRISVIIRHTQTF
jgi:hypothetical protein